MSSTRQLAQRSDKKSLCAVELGVWRDMRETDGIDDRCAFHRFITGDLVAVARSAFPQPRRCSADGHCRSTPLIDKFRNAPEHGLQMLAAHAVHIEAFVVSRA
jgi:hypothetical protein